MVWVIVMKKVASLSIFLVVCLFGMGFFQIIGTTGNVLQLSAKLRNESIQTSYQDYGRYQTLLTEAYQRALFYEEEIQKKNLSMGMVVNHDDHYNRILAECDSLLFSSLRYVALKKMGLHGEANDAWQAILKANDHGKWHRHPKCKRRWTSRDMIVGLLAALSQRPEDSRLYLQDLMSYVDKTGGYIGSGPFYVSKLSPGLAEIIRHLARREGIADSALPPDIKYGFSTIEFDTFTAGRGYTSHLNALVIWLEMELRAKKSLNKVRSVTELLDQLLNPFKSHSIEDQRLMWVSHKLVDLDERNLFFRWLQLRSAGALTEKSKAQMLEELLSMDQFPADRLPQNCDRKADYLWQRDSIEYTPHSGECTETFSGVDFLWMVSLLTPE
ncbi:hypothetical protein SAMN06296036_11133 [Pseudobacteriovorax antillogorgiicola]|uniref:Prenyltransferase and squalene oxidase repeat-containing protein n=3 Tax=Pseudobacteriovorax antillogorgiicola TaxID=1513793 RepID=A0A1Y6BYP9_9BACT|nr:hypothetical protein EDD56_111145 [Pseudobacteriovorax antillogorgiicola]SMF36435.1 hypothetical protein SAMN06296036_11133 [Pseudobacteriovorax antillogorgiicola]